MNRTAVLLAAAASILASASPANAQKYFMRERIVGVPAAAAPTYVPVYSSTYGACTNGKKTAPITGCTSNGATVATSLCSKSPQTTSVDCTITCGTLTSRRVQSVNNSIAGQTTKSTQALAQSACTSLAATYGAGVCRWNSGSAASNEYLSFYVPGVLSTSDAGQGAEAAYATVCQ